MSRALTMTQTTSVAGVQVLGQVPLARGWGYHVRKPVRHPCHLREKAIVLVRVVARLDKIRSECSYPHGRAAKEKAIIKVGLKTLPTIVV